jgi:hypothetical protein
MWVNWCGRVLEQRMERGFVEPIETQFQGKITVGTYFNNSERQHEHFL